jgi:hypothetical protein
MQVRRKTPILEARQFTEEGALALLKDGWLKATVVTADGTSGTLTRSAGRTSAVELGDWIVRDIVHLATEQVVDGTGREVAVSEWTPQERFRAISAERFAEDFEVVDDTAKAKRERPIAEQLANGDLEPESKTP